MNIIDGKSIALKILNDIKEEISVLTPKPKLGIIQIGFDEATQIYVNHKVNDAKQVGMDCEVFQFDSITTVEILELTNQLNKREDINGYIIQLPFKTDESIREIFKSISVKKDIDGLNPLSLGYVWHNNGEGFLPATVRAIVECLKHVTIYSDNKYSVNELSNSYVQKELHDYLKGKNVVIINDSIIVGRSISGVLLNSGATISICHKFTQNLREYTRKADVIISATGVPNLLDSSITKDNSVIIDVGIKRLKDSIVGDVNYESFKNTNCWVTPVPGGVGPLTRAMLLENVLEAYKAQKGR